MPSVGQLKAIFDTLGDGLFVADAHGRYIEANPSACQMLGYSRDELLKLSIADLLDPSEWPKLPSTVSSMRDGAVHRSEWLFRRSDGSTFEGELVGGRLPDGTFQSIVRDISARLEAARRQHLLTQEAAHRTKNILALVQAIVHQTARSSPETFVEAVNRRIRGLGASLDLFVSSAWDAVSVDALVRAQLAPFVSSSHQVQVGGPDVTVGTAAAQSLGIALHELATNAAKYGALSNPDGQLQVQWSVEPSSGSPSFVMSWLERGGPEVVAPKRVGFGTRIIAAMVESGLQAKTALAYDRTGFSWRMECPLESIERLPASRATSGLTAADLGAKSEIRIALLSQTPTGLELGASTEAAGIRIVSTPATPDDLRAQIDAGDFDVALLDLDAVGPSEMLALEMLAAAAKPVIVILGEGQTLPSAGVHAMLLYRPVTIATLVSRVATAANSASANKLPPAVAPA